MKSEPNLTAQVYDTMWQLMWALRDHADLTGMTYYLNPLAYEALQYHPVFTEANLSETRSNAKRLSSEVIAFMFGIPIVVVEDQDERLGGEIVALHQKK
jgi:hypothetical protein